jgi:hypothetical protein
MCPNLKWITSSIHDQMLAKLRFLLRLAMEGITSGVGAKRSILKFLVQNICENLESAFESGQWPPYRNIVVYVAFIYKCVVFIL